LVGTCFMIGKLKFQSKIWRENGPGLEELRNFAEFLADFPTKAGVPISNKTMITTGTKHAQACGNMTLAWHKWKHCPLTSHTWPNWKCHWTAAFAKMHIINRMTAKDTAFGANQASKLKYAQQMASSLDNLANATIQKNTFIENLVATNAMLTKAIAII
jgi:hypothetical protein